MPPYQRVTTTTWSSSPSVSSIRRMIAPAPASPSSALSPSPPIRAAHELWVALANLRCAVSAASAASIAARSATGPPETA
ncbi:hypothetical protein IX57_01590 [Paracoccus sanguinis]|nr:hypothetical protein IX57_01590 [Paracoccus sanguinis]